MIEADVAKANAGTVVELFELDASNVGGEVLRFHAGVNELGTNLVWQGNTYTKLPIEADGFEMRGSGKLPRPRLSVANVDGLIGALTRELQDLVGAKVIRRRTFLRYLDAVNFTGGTNPTADPNVGFPDEIWFVDRKASENSVVIEFELAAPFDVQGVRIPRRQCIQSVCLWQYRSAECGYAGGPVANKNDEATTVAAEDDCGKRLNSCRLRFGTFGELPFGGFPGVGLLR